MSRGCSPREASVRLVIVPHAGAGGSAGLGLAAVAPASWHVATVRLPGRESRLQEQPHTTFDCAVREVTTIIASIPGSAPLLVIGSCSGALTSYAALIPLEIDPETSFSLVAVSCPPPSYPPQSVAGGAWNARLHDLVRTGTLDPRIAANEDLARLTVPALLADISIASANTISLCSRLRSPILAIGGSDDVDCSPHRLREWSLFAERCETRTLPHGGTLLLRDSPIHIVGAILSEREFLGLPS